MTLSGIELSYLVNEISSKTKDYYVSNIYGITRNSLLFKLHHPEKPDLLLMFSTFGFWITNVKISQMEENRLIKRLRNDLLRSRIINVEQIGSERIVQVTFSGFNQEFILIGEFFGDGNILLCNKEMKILSLLHSIDVRHRKLGVGLTYATPPSSGSDIFKVTQKDLEEIKSASTVTVRWIGRTLGLPTKYAEEIMKRSNIDGQRLGNTLTSEEVTSIYQATREMIEKVVNGKHDPYIVRDDKGADVYPIPLGDISQKNVSKVSSFMEGLDALFSENLLEQGKTSKTDTVSQKIIETEHKLEEQNKAISLVKLRAEAISNVAKALFGLASFGVTSIEDTRVPPLLQERNSSLIRENGILMINVEEDKVKINPQSSIQAIASILFNESKRQLKAIETIESEKIKTEKNLAAFRKQATITQDSIVFSIQKKKEWYERYRWFYTSDGLLAIGGRDSSSNSSVIRKHLGKNDRVFHAEIVGSPFFILKDSEDEIASSITEVAQATVCFSRAWREGLYGLNAYWVKPDQIKMGAPTGQFLAKGAFPIEGTRNFVQVSNLQLAIGLHQKNDSYTIMSGPLSAVKTRCLFYVIIEPSGTDMTDLAKKVRLEFLKLAENQDVVKAFNIDDFIRALPAGDSHIVESGIGQGY
ncbi:RNA-binding protein [Candidatus Nitrosotalea sp. TS]|uniref:ribosome rescue protein RqcH n=1 Tax=Candidatus Nitrosotalea sp. TS TaxID=2341020 RepID=UPI001409ACF8|nr:ribosome rescue protein RqcH [Candidatus Nitrosotalea sp. TS]NHI04119.1 RNA-binding protein [Candidatus Nitrosotalea sp. TS]